MATTLVLGATPNPTRYAYRATLDLIRNGEQVVLVGIKQGEVAGRQIQQHFPPAGSVDTVTLYLGPERQAPLVSNLLSLKPRRVIFNPGAENPELAEQLLAAGIEPVVACTLVMLATHQYHL